MERCDVVKSEKRANIQLKCGSVKVISAIICHFTMKIYKTCAAYGCTPPPNSKLSLYSFPKNKHFYKIWKIRCCRKDQFPKFPLLCEKHFSEKQRKRNLKHELVNYIPKKCRPLKEDAVPDLFLPQIVKKGEWLIDSPMFEKFMAAWSIPRAYSQP